MLKGSDIDAALFASERLSGKSRRRFPAAPAAGILPVIFMRHKPAP
jgi:hypothetical protein